MISEMKEQKTNFLTFQLLIAFLIILISNSLNAQQYDYSPGFDAGAPVEMSNLKFLEGDWEIILEFAKNHQLNDTSWIPWGKTSSKIESVFNGAFLMETCSGFPVQPEHEGFSAWEYIAIFSYDRFQNKYRATYSDNLWGLHDVYEGNFIDGKFNITDFETGTHNNTGPGGIQQANRIIISDITDDGFILYWQTGQGKDLKNIKESEANWIPGPRMIYKRVNK